MLWVVYRYSESQTKFTCCLSLFEIYVGTFFILPSKNTFLPGERFEQEHGVARLCEKQDPEHLPLVHTGIRWHRRYKYLKLVCSSWCRALTLGQDVT